MPAGRPTKYSDGMHRRAEQYVEHCRKQGDIPFIEELELELGVDDSTIVAWGEQHEGFSATIKRLKTLQKFRLMKDALNKKIQPAPAIFLLKANHGLNEKEPQREDAYHVYLQKFCGSDEYEEIHPQRGVKQDNPQG